jgi:SAM-dependent methyltransferase
VKIDLEVKEVDERRQKWETRYREDDLPWDTGITPPEVQAFWAAQPHGTLAIDLGCGTGTNAAFLARHNEQAVGIELALNALRIAQQRQLATGDLGGSLAFVQADVARLPFYGLSANYILDIGCFHAVPQEDRTLYARGVVNNLRQGGHYHLYAADRVENKEGEGSGPSRNGFGPDEIETLFTPDMEVVEILRGAGDSFPSRWYLLRKA